MNLFKTRVAKAVYLLLAILSPSHKALYCQSVTEYFTHVFNEKRLYINYTPFDNIEVIDNRFDTTNILTVENGIYPLHKINIEQPAAYTIKHYILTAIAKLPKGNKTLLMSLKQLRVTNKSYVYRRRGKETCLLFGGLMFEADLFYKTGRSKYKKILTIHKKYYSENILQQGIATILNEALEAASNLNGNSLSAITTHPRKLKYLSKDTRSFVYTKDTAVVALEQINTNQQQKWADYLINSNPILSNGWYQNFDDFRDNKLTPGFIQMKWDDKDSIFVIDSKTRAAAKLQNGLPWAVCDSGNIYMALGPRAYLKLGRLNNTFYFYVPYTLPDMYAMLSMEKTGDDFVSAPSTGNILADLVGIVVTASIDYGIETAKNKKIRKNGLKSNYRNCYIDMDTGDIIYYRCTIIQ